jgi:transposase
MHLTDTHWGRIAHLLQRPTSLDPRGPKRKDPRLEFEGVLWILRTGAQWKELPRTYGAYQTVFRRYREWVDRGAIGEALALIAQELEDTGQLSLDECFIDGTFASAKKGVVQLVLQNAEKGRKSWLLRMEALFRSPSLYPVLLQAKSPWWKQRLTPVIRKRLHSVSLETKRTTVIPLMRD